jgi:hypothetical protein
VIANVPPAVLVEGGFLTNKEDIAETLQRCYREQIAAAIGRVFVTAIAKTSALAVSARRGVRRIIAKCERQTTKIEMN